MKTGVERYNTVLCHNRSQGSPGDPSPPAPVMAEKGGGEDGKKGGGAARSAALKV